MKYSFGGGINELNDIAISPEEAVLGQNFELGLGNTKFKPRAPFDLLDTTTNTSNIHGLHQLIKQDGTKTTLVASGTDMYTWTGTVFTDVGNVISTSEFHDFDWELDETIIIVDREKDDVVKEWDGTTFSNLTHGISGVTSFYAKYGLVTNGRVLLANVTTDSDENAHLCAFSEFENRQNFDTTTRSGDGGFTTGNEPFYILTPDGKEINGLFEFQNAVLCSTVNGQLYRLVGDDSTNYRWVDFYKGSAAIGTNSFANVGNDAHFMREGGVIESLRSTDTFGDVGTDDISLPVKDIVKNQTGCKMVYDQTNRKILYLFNSSILVLYKDLIGTEKSPFSLYKTSHPVAFNTDAIRYMELPGSTDKTVLFGDDNGNIYDLNGVGTGDGGSYDIQVTRKLPLQDFNYASQLIGNVYYRRQGQCNLNMEFDWGDEGNTTDVSMTLKGVTGGNGAAYFGGDVYFGGDFYFNQGFLASSNPVSKGFSAIGKGTSVFVTLEITTSEYFEIDYIEA